MPRVSVIVPVWDGERFLAEALGSIAGLGDGEVVVVDDGSSDRSGEIARAWGPPVRCVAQPHRGLPAARNRGLDVAGGDAITFLDADDLWTEDKLRRQTELLARHPGIDVVLGRTRRFANAEQGPPELALSLGAALLRRSVFERVGRFDESFTYCDDWDWFMRARELGVTIGVHDDVVLRYRRHEANMTNDAAEGNRFFSKVLRSSLARRRRAGTQELPKLVTLE